MLNRSGIRFELFLRMQSGRYRKGTGFHYLRLSFFTESSYIEYMLKRTVYLLNLLKENQPVTAASLAESLDVSERTIRYDISRLNENGIENGYEILSMPHHGYILKVNDHKKLHSFKKDNRPDTIPVEPDDRFGYLATILLVRNSGISLRRIEDELFISNATARKVLGDVTAELSKYGIAIHLKNGQYRAAADEENIRFCLADIMIRYRISRYYRNFDEIRFRSIRRKMFGLMDRHGIHFPIVSFNHFQIYLFIDITRIYHGRSLDTDRFKEPAACREKDFVEDLADFVYSEYEIELNRQEKALLTYRALGLNMDYHRKDAGRPEHEQVIFETFRIIQNAFGPDFSEDTELISALLSHMVTLEYRIRYHTLILNPLLNEIRIQYPLAWNMAKILSDMLALKYGREVYDEETAYIAVIFQNAVEHTAVLNRKKVLLVSGSTPGIANRLKTQIMNIFRGYIQSIDYDDNPHVYGLDLGAYDVIISTTDIDRKTDIPIIRINDLLDDTGIKRLRIYFEQ